MVLPLFRPVRARLFLPAGETNHCTSIVRTYIHAGAGALQVASVIIDYRRALQRLQLRLGFGTCFM